MRRFLLFFILAGFFFPAGAATINQYKAKLIALNWMNTHGRTYYTLSDISSVYSKVDDRIPKLYIVSFDSVGWVMISGTDQVEPVLGYSNNSIFDIDSLPEQAKWWVNQRTDEISTVIEKRIVPSAELQKKWNSLGSKIIAKKDIPMLKSASFGPLLSVTWNQGRYYNGMAPADERSSAGNGHVWIGCVATAMAQIMKYWEYPTIGLGSHSYHHANYGQLSADFANSYYDWASMPNSLSADNAEVQEISYHCAVSVDMNFGPYSSGAFLEDATAAYCNNFKYNSAIFGSEKSRWDDAEWESLLRRDIEAGRPVFYSGYNQSYTSGHAWVCDGYSDNYFHFNWGWGGVANGNFLLSNLNPGSSNYSYNQAAIFSIEPVRQSYFDFPYTEDFENGNAGKYSVMGVSQVTSEESHIGSLSLRLGKDGVSSDAVNAASLCFLVPSNSSVNFWVKRITPEVSSSNQQKVLIMSEWGTTPLETVFDGDYNDDDWVNYSVDLSAYAGQLVRLMFVQEVHDYTKQQWMYIDDVSLIGTDVNLPPFTPSKPSPTDGETSVSVYSKLKWSDGDPNGDDLVFQVYLGTTNPPSLAGSVFDNEYSSSALSQKTKYYWQVVADDGELKTSSQVWSFTTRGIPPTVANCGLTNIGKTSVDICGKIVSDNGEKVLSEGVCWGTTVNSFSCADYTKSIDSLFTCSITGLIPYTTHYYRSYAESDEGFGYSDILSFKTLPDYAVLSNISAEDITRTSATINCNIQKVYDSAITRRGVVWSTEPNFDPLTATKVEESGSWKDPVRFSTYLTNLFGPTLIYYRVFAENSVGISYSSEQTFQTPNVAPTIDLDADNSTKANFTGFFGRVYEQQSGGIIADNDVAIDDADGDSIRKIIVVLTNPINGTGEFLTFTGDETNLTISGKGTDSLTLESRKVSNQEWCKIIQKVEYFIDYDAPDNKTKRAINVYVSDGFDLSDPATAQITVLLVNDPPVLKIAPSFETVPVFNDSAFVNPGVWADELDKEPCSYKFSYEWQVKNAVGEITTIADSNVKSLLILEEYCGDSIRIVETVTDSGCGGFNTAETSATSKWCEILRIPQSVVFSLIPSVSLNEQYCKLNGSASSGLPLTFEVPSSSNVVISNDTAYLQSVGRSIVSCYQEGNACYLPSDKVFRIIQVVKGNQSIIGVKDLKANIGDKLVKLPAESTSGLPLTVASSDQDVAYFQNDSIVLAGIGAATFTISQPGNENFNPAPNVELKVTVSKGDQTITFLSNDTIYYGGGTSQLLATSSAGLPVNIESLNPEIIDISNGMANVKAVGNAQVKLTQSGNEYWSAANDLIVNLHVLKGRQEIVIAPIPEIKYNSQPYRPDVKVLSGLETTLSVANNSIAEIVDGQIVAKGVGETVVIAQQDGNEFWEKASAQTILKVVKGDQTIFSSIPDTVLMADRSIFADVVASSGLPVVVTSSDKNVLNVSGDSIFAIGEGNATLSFVQGGNENYLPANSNQKIVVVKGVGSELHKSLDFSLYPNPTSGHLNLVVDNDVDFPCHMSVINALGMVVRSFNVSESFSTFELKEIPSGVYFVVVRSARYYNIQKLVVER